MKFLLKVNAVTDSDNWYGIAVVDLSKDEIQTMLSRRELFQMVKSRDAQLVDMFFFDSTNCTYYENAELEDVLNKSELALFELEEVALFADPERDEDLEKNVGEMERTDIDQVIIDDVGIRFFAGLKHTNACIESVYIKYDQLLTALRA